MLLLETQNLQPGQVAAAPVRHPANPDVELIMPGVPLDARMIDTLKRLEVPKMWVRWPGLDFLEAKLNSRVASLRDDVYATLKKDFEAAQATTVGVTQYVRYCNLISDLIIQLLVDAQNGLAAQTAALFDTSRDLFSHSANVTYLSLTLGLRLETYVTRERRRAGAMGGVDLTNLGVGAMLHDIGKLQMPSTLAIHEPVDRPPTQAYAEHPRRGCWVINNRISSTARAVVMHHHQRFDGSGFPDMAAVTRKRRKGPLRGRHIHIFPRIVALCDTFEHLCHEEDGRPRPTVAALHDLLNGGLSGRFDPIVYRGLLRHVPPFAMGMKVVLNDGQEAAVISLNKDRPCRPAVRLLGVENPQKRDVDLARHEELRIVTALGARVEKWLYELPPDNPAVEKTVLAGRRES